MLENGGDNYDGVVMPAVNVYKYLGSLLFL